MGQCRYCGENAGLFRRRHQECDRQYKEGWKEMISLSSNTAHGQGDEESLQSRYGIGVMWDAASAKPQTFVTGDGWFTYNLVTGLAQR